MMVIVIWLLTSSLAIAAEDDADKDVESAKVAVRNAIGGEGEAGDNSVLPISAQGLVVHLMKDVDTGLASMAKLPAEHRDHILAVQFYVPPRSPDAWNSLSQLDVVEEVMLTNKAKWSREFGENITKLKRLQSLHICDANVDCAGIEQISRCTKLTNLWLHDNDLSKCDLTLLVNLKELRQLMMCNANVSSAQMKFADFLPKLGWIAISENHIDRATIDRLEQIFPKALIVADDQKEQ